ncbi:type IA DNA topoisomerase [Alkalihalophilus marmarensis]|uniref:type IA DNA topoisomerase n=1 Tax=Alkalihalophilus marmarensis TaxID=521377 RepID=UPI002DB9604C|nr:DNA topoisomerase [Alkalihalophilus marmarensis]MEC2074415.1 DNA topoisomerase [Alkalihalophilus marmarensis]
MKNLFILVVKRILAAHYPDVVMSHKEIITEVMGRFTFKSKGKELLSKGWHHVIPATDERDIMLPTLLKESVGDVTNTLTTKSKTKPPNRYTSSSLIGFMKNAAQAIEVEEMKSIKNLPLGTEATRAGLITLLESRKYIEWKNNKVYPTLLGITIIDSIKMGSVIKSPILTAKWDVKLNEIGASLYNHNDFIAHSKKLSSVLFEEVKTYSTKWNQNGVERIKSDSIGACLLCGSNVILRKGKHGEFYGCSNYEDSGCSLNLPFKVLNKKLSKKQLMELLQKGETDIIEGFKWKDKTFNAPLVWNREDQKVQFGK